MLQKADKIRLDRVIEILERLDLRFPNAEVVKRTGENKGNVSAHLNGKKPMPDNFYKTFIKEFVGQVDEVSVDLAKQMGEVLEDLVYLKASDRIQGMKLAELAAKLNKTSFSSEALELGKNVRSEADRLYEERIKLILPPGCT